MSDIEFYKKYRPGTLKDFAGNDSLVSSLMALLETNSLPHTILFHGPSGCGKTTLARILSEALGIQEIDYAEYDSANFRGIDTARQIREGMLYPPISGKFKMVVLDEAHKLTNDAQNALLKPLEDTPPHLYFILCTTNPEKLIKAIRTRCASYEVKSLEPRVMGPKVLLPVCKKEGLHVSKEVLKAICRSSAGSSREALQLLYKVSKVENEEDQLNLCKSSVDEAEEVNLAKAILANDWQTCAKAIKSIEESAVESVRIGILRYLQAVLLNGGDLGVFAKMCAFEKDSLTNGKAQLTLACFEATHQA